MGTGSDSTEYVELLRFGGARWKYGFKDIQARQHGKTTRHKLAFSGLYYLLKRNQIGDVSVCRAHRRTEQLLQEIRVTATWHREGALQ